MMTAKLEKRIMACIKSTGRCHIENIRSLGITKYKCRQSVPFQFAIISDSIQFRLCVFEGAFQIERYNCLVVLQCKATAKKGKKLVGS